MIESPGYTPFEQLQSRGNVGPWSDLYALGGTLCKAITGEAPPKAMDRMMGDPWIGLAGNSHLPSSYSRAFLQAIDRSMAVDPKNRWQNAEQWMDALQNGGKIPANLSDPPSLPRPNKTAQPIPAAPVSSPKGSARTKMNSCTTGYTNIYQVPWFRRSIVNNTALFVSFFLCGVGVLPVCINMLANDIYYHKKDEHGYLKKWGLKEKITSGLLLAIWLLIIRSILTHS